MFHFLMMCICFSTLHFPLPAFWVPSALHPTQASLVDSPSHVISLTLKHYYYTNISHTKLSPSPVSSSGAPSHLSVLWILDLSDHMQPEGSGIQTNLSAACWLLLCKHACTVCTGAYTVVAMSGMC